MQVLHFTGKLIVTAGLVALSWAFFGNQISYVRDYVPTLNYYWMPIVVSSGIEYRDVSFIIGSNFGIIFLGDWNRIVHNRSRFLQHLWNGCGYDFPLFL